ncbi:MAG: hypothetical protein ACFFD4_32430 [Candidatus Odinarchaeota archaeon]
MAQSKILNSYCRKPGALLMFLIPVIILVFLLLGQFQVDSDFTLIAAFFWILLLLNSLMFMANGVMIVRDFKQQTAKKAEEGFPIDSIEGFSSTSKFTTSILSSSSLISIIIFISLVLFLAAVLVVPVLEVIDGLLSGVLDFLKTEEDFDWLYAALSPVIMFSAVGLSLIAIGIVLLLKIPDKPIFEPGAMLKYYTPQQTPLALDNLLSDAVISFLDPITRIRFDEWTESIENSLNKEFEPGMDYFTRLEQAREKILLLFYLKDRMPALFPDEVFKAEMTEVIDESKFTDFAEGKGSGISFEIWGEVFHRLQDQIPEVFKTIDRLVIELSDNLADFKENEDLWVTVSAPDKVVGNRKPFRILVFALNKSPDFTDKKRLVAFHATGAQDNFMEKIDYNLGLDEAEDLKIKDDKLPFVSDGSQDILGLLSKLLQIGDAVWFTFERRTFKNHMFSISITEGNRGSIYGTSIGINVTRDINFYISQYGGQLSAVAGLIVPAASFALTLL